MHWHITHDAHYPDFGGLLDVVLGFLHDTLP